MKTSAGRMAAIVLALFVARLFAAGAAAEPAFTWSNPLAFEYSEGQTAPRREIRDPCIVRDGDRYYLVFTMWPFRGREDAHLSEPNGGGSPGIALYSSPDLKSWKFENWLVKSSELTADCPYKHRFWAPEIHRVGGKFYLVFTADNWYEKKHNPAGSWGSAGYAFVGVADRIGGPYEHITYIPGGACDTTLFEDSDGRTYAFIPAMDVFVQEIDLSRLHEDRVRLSGERRKVVTADNSDVGMEARPEYLEGPWAMKTGNRYLLFFAGPYPREKFPGHEGYWSGVAYADNALGPWKKDPRGQVFWGGHMAVFIGPGDRPWCSYRGEKIRETQGLLCIDPLEMDGSGMVCGHGPTVGEKLFSLPVPGMETGDAADLRWRIPSNAPLLSRWAKQVSPANALPEYPRPQMRRDRWMNLNGLWDYAIAVKANERVPSSFEVQILVPFPIESALSGVMRSLRQDERLWCRRSFTIPSEAKRNATGWSATIARSGRSTSRSSVGRPGATARAAEPDGLQAAPPCARGSGQKGRIKNTQWLRVQWRQSGEYAYESVELTSRISSTRSFRRSSE